MGGDKRGAHAKVHRDRCERGAFNLVHPLHALTLLLAEQNLPHYGFSNPGGGPTRSSRPVGGPTSGGRAKLTVGSRGDSNARVSTGWASRCSWIAFRR